MLFEADTTVSSAEEQKSNIHLRKAFWEQFMPEEYQWVPKGFDEDDDSATGGRATTTYGGDTTNDASSSQPDLEPGTRVKMSSKGYEPVPEGLDVDNPNPLGAGFDAPMG